jgi:phosphoribosylaminoimidazole-succinocarboxamide synthase
MISEDVIRAQLENILDGTDFLQLGKAHKGKVRDSYSTNGRRILITTDRVSAFDCIIGTVPFKGQVLNQMAGFWFETTRDIAPNHIIDIPDPNVLIAAECEPLPLEFVVRGYITGVTKTSAWMNYEQGVRNFCGNLLPDGLKKDQKLEQPILTPTTKHEKHDRNISRDEAITEGLIDAETFDAAADICFKLFARGQEHAAGQGLILVDTKYEIGMLDGALTVIDEIHTPDSSRYWFADTYDELFEKGENQRKIDKEYIREWLAAQGFRGDGKPPALTDEVRVEAARRYIQAYEHVTGLEFKPVEGPILKRVEESLLKFTSAAS